jgi:serine O-acetyltransferase
MDKAFLHKLYQNHRACPTCATPAEIALFFSDLIATLFADFSQVSFATEDDFEKHFLNIRKELERILGYNSISDKTESSTVSGQFFNALPLLYEKINQDVTATFEGDPAAKSRSEVIRTYPGFYAIAAYRVANELH